MPDREPHYGLFRLPSDLRPGELKNIRQGHPLPVSYRGFVSEHETNEEANKAWSKGLFVRKIADV